MGQSQGVQHTLKSFSFNTQISSQIMKSIFTKHKSVLKYTKSVLKIQNQAFES